MEVSNIMKTFSLGCSVGLQFVIKTLNGPEVFTHIMTYITVTSINIRVSVNARITLTIAKVC